MRNIVRSARRTMARNAGLAGMYSVGGVLFIAGVVGANNCIT